MMNYQDKFELTTENNGFFSNKFDIVVTGFRDKEDDRHQKFLNDLSDFKGLIYSFDVCEKAEKFHYKKQNSSYEIIDEQSDCSLIPDLEKLLRSEKFRGTNVCIDITSVKQALLFVLIKILLRDLKPAHLFSAYTEPLSYKKKQFDIAEPEEFDLYDGMIGSSKSVPGFNKAQSKNKQILLIASIGFDSQRLQTIYENLKPTRLIPVVGFPSFIPGWNLTAIKMNYRVLKESDSCEFIESCEAASPFEIFNTIKEIYFRESSDYDIYLCPLGTRPHVLGIALFATIYFPKVYLIYDFPLEKKFRSEHILKVNIFHLSNYIQ